MKHISDQFRKENVEEDMQDYNQSESNLSPVIITLEHENGLEDDSVVLDESSTKEDDDDATVYYDTEENNEVTINEFSRKKSAYYDTTENYEGSIIDDGSRKKSFSNQNNLNVTLRSIDLLCPAWIDIYKSKNRYHRLYAFVLPGSSKTLLRSSTSFSNYVSSSSNTTFADVAFSMSSRLSSAEKRRRCMGLALADMYAGAEIYANQIYELVTPVEKLFLQRDNFETSCKGEGRMDGLVARALSEYHWIEEYTVMTKNSISFYSPDTTKNKFSCRVIIEDIIDVEKLDPDNSPSVPGYYFLSFSTLARTYYLMLSSESDCENWITNLAQNIAHKKGSDCGSISTVDNNSVRSINTLWENQIDDPSKEFLHKSTMWNYEKRRILNCRKFAFNSSKHNRSEEKIICEVLQYALDPSESGIEEHNLQLFLDGAADLKTIHLSNLHETQKLAFFINLYHIMIIHAYLVLGPPSSSFKWISYFNKISYQCADEIFSLAELEHCIMRSTMSYPSQFMSKYILPKSRYSFAMKLSDFRINFALNCGSLSNPSSIPIYNSHNLDDMLNCATRLYLKDTVQVSIQKKKSASGVLVFVTLPKICQWYARDFSDKQDIDMIMILLPFFPEDKQNLLLGSIDYAEKSKLGLQLQDKQLIVKYSNYNFKCRSLTLLDS